MGDDHKLPNAIREGKSYLANKTPQEYVAAVYAVWRKEGKAPDLLALAMIQGGIEILRDTVGPGNWADDLEALAKWARETNPDGKTGERALN